MCWRRERKEGGRAGRESEHKALRHYYDNGIIPITEDLVGVTSKQNNRTTTP